MNDGPIVVTIKPPEQYSQSSQLIPRIGLDGRRGGRWHEISCRASYLKFAVAVRIRSPM